MPAPWKGRRTRLFAGYDVALVPPTLSLQGDTGAFPVCHQERGSFRPRRGHHVHLNSSIGSASEVVASVTRLNWTMKSAAVAASTASKITMASGLPSNPRNSWTMTLFGIFGCLNRRVASSHCPGRTLSCVTQSMASRRAHQGPTLYNDAVPATDRRRRSPRSDGCGHGSDGT